MIDTLRLHAGRHGAAHHVARRQLVDEAFAVSIAHQGAVAAQGLRQERARHGGVMQRRRMELHELDVGRRNAGPQGHGHTVTRGLGRVGGDRVQLAGPAGGQDDVASLHQHRGVPTGWQGADTGAATVVDHQVECEPALEDGAGRAVGGVDQRPFDLGTGRGASGVHHPWRRVAALARQGQRPRRFAVELNTQCDQLVHPARALVDQNAHGLFVTEPDTGGQGVGQVQVGRVLVATQDRGDTALGPPGGRLGQHALGQHAQADRRRRPAPGASAVAGSRRSACRDGSGQADRGGQPGDPAAQDQHVEGTGAHRARHAGSGKAGRERTVSAGGRAEPASSASRRADASSMARLRASTCTTRGA